MLLVHRRPIWSLGKEKYICDGSSAIATLLYKQNDAGSFVRSFLSSFTHFASSRRTFKIYGFAHQIYGERERGRNERREQEKDCSTSHCLCKQLSKSVAPYFDVSPCPISSVNIFHLHPLWSSILLSEKEVWYI